MFISNLSIYDSVIIRTMFLWMVEYVYNVNNQRDYKIILEEGEKKRYFNIFWKGYLNIHCNDYPNCIEKFANVLPPINCSNL